MRDVVLVTVDAVRRDLVDAMPFVADHDVLTGVTPGHYTRPSLAGVQSSHLRSALQSRVVGPTLAGAAGVDTPGGWQGVDVADATTEWAVTVDRAAGTEALTEFLRTLGYTDGR